MAADGDGAVALGLLLRWRSKKMLYREAACMSAGGASCRDSTNTKTTPPFEVKSKRRKGFPSERRVKRGERVVHGDKELVEKLGRNDPCPCGSGKRFQEMLPARRRLLTAPIAPTTGGIE